MEEDLNQPADCQSRDILEIPTPPSASQPRIPSNRESWSGGESPLQAEALRGAKSWISSSKQKRNARSLWRKWQLVSKAVRDSSARLREAPLPERAGDAELEWLNDNLRLLKTAVGETRGFVKAAGGLPEIEASKGPAIKRVYAATEAYLRAVSSIYEEETFLTFFVSIQGLHPLDISELWALKPTLQFVLLEQLASATERILDDDNHPTGRGMDSQNEPTFSVPRLITSLRDVGESDWQGIFERLSVAEKILREDPSGTFPSMDFESRNLYLQAIQELAASSRASEPEVAQSTISLARTAQCEWSSDPRVQQRRRHVGYYLIDEGRELLERQIHCRPPFSKQIDKAVLAWPEVFYFVGIELLTFAAMAFVLTGALNRVPLTLGVLLLLLPATEAAVGVMNQLVHSILSPRMLPKLDFAGGIPSESATLVVVPTLLADEQYVAQMARELEVRYLANRDPHLHFALLTDSPDSSHPVDDRDGLVGLCASLIEELNHKYAADGRGSFFLFHRHHVFNPSEGTWMGWERKRGKLLDLNCMLRGNPDSFQVRIGDLSILPKIRFVITLDSDTQLPRGAAHRLIGAMAHPLNRAVIDPRTNTVVEGYGMLQPRVGVSVHAASRSRLASIYSGQTGFDIYTRATSDVYQDLFGEGSFTGKGIYEVDVFQTVLGERFPNNAILSHDLIEGAHARAGLVSDVEVVDDYPSNFSAFSRRKHRWVRGDWQIIRWLFRRVPDFRGRMVPNPLNLISRWKILDNLRRSITEIATFALLLAGWFRLPGNPLHWTLATLVLMLIPTYVQLLLSLLRLIRVQYLSGYLRDVGTAFIEAQVNVFFLLAFLSNQTLVTLDAIVRTIIRLTITRRKLLEWETAAESDVGIRKAPVDAYLGWTPWLSLVIGSALALGRPTALAAAFPLLVLWACSGALARWLNRPVRLAKTKISTQDQEFLRLACLRTWRFFRQHAGDAANGLVPDNIQEAPPDVAHRISPTNLGLLLNSQLAAFELGYLTLPEFIVEAERTLTTAKRLLRYRGHFFNWYDTRTLQPLEPFFVSTVDSGNLACCLWTLKQGLLKTNQLTLFRPAMWDGLRDHFMLLEEIAAHRASEQMTYRIRQLSAWVDLLGENDMAWIRTLPVLEESILQVERSLTDESDAGDELHWWISETKVRIRSTRTMLRQLTPWLMPEYSEVAGSMPTNSKDFTKRLGLDTLPGILADLDGKLQELMGGSAIGFSSVGRAATSMRQTLPRSMAEAEGLSRKLQELARDADTLVREMDFQFLYNPRRKTLWVGYDAKADQFGPSCYDLLASEARNAAFVAIAKGDIPQESWFHLGRAHVRWEGEQVLLSWAGAMFEYLMPTLWSRNYPHTILDQTAHAAVRCQRKWAHSKGTPWGISEAAYSKRNPVGHYQYEPFGVPALALRRSSADNLVVSPYATFLALPVDPCHAVQNLQTMKSLGWLGPFGFYEAADFAPSRVDRHEKYKLVRCWMAHHQGMSLLAGCNLLVEEAVQNLFHADPAVAATERLLHEQLPSAIRVEPAEEPAPLGISAPDGLSQSKLRGGQHLPVRRAEKACSTVLDLNPEA